MLSDDFLYDTAGPALRGAGSSLRRLGPLLLTIHITNMQLNFYFFNQ